MDIKLLKLAMERLSDELNQLKQSHSDLKQEVKQLRTKQPDGEPAKEQPDEFLTTKEVLSMLGVCYNTLQKVIRTGLITPIRINQRRVVFSRKMLMEYIYSKVPAHQRPTAKSTS